MIGPKKHQASDSSENEVLQSKICDHLGLVAGVFEELEIGDRIAKQITQVLDERDQGTRFLVPSPDRDVV